jgi:hypothetical protein
VLLIQVFQTELYFGELARLRTQLLSGLTNHVLASNWAEIVGKVRRVGVLEQVDSYYMNIECIVNMTYSLNSHVPI